MTAHRPRATWSIERRFIRWITVSSLTLVALFTAGAIWFESTELHNELTLLGAEEIEELETNLRGRTFARTELESTLVAIAADHPDHRFTWRLWRLDDGALWGDSGPTPRFPLPRTAAEVTNLSRAPAPGTRFHWIDVPVVVRDEPRFGTLRVALLLDAAPRRITAARTMGLLVGVLLLAAVASIVGGVWMARKMASTLREAADGARRMDSNGGTSEMLGLSAPDKSDAPEEVLAIVGAFREHQEALRAQYSRNLLLTAGMAHELRSPLQNMLGEASIALLRDREAPEYRALLESQLEELRDLGRVVDNLITLTALREPRALGRKERFELGDEVELRLATDIAQAAKRSITLEIERDGDLAVAGDREALLLAVRNLVNNAVRHAPDGGRVEVALHGDTQRLTVTVDDDGPGVPGASHQAIFEDFHQAQADGKRRGGYGLGLALARAAAEAHGGQVTVGDSPLGGARFVLELPRTA